MRTWKIAASLMACGRCVGWIEKGKPYQLVHLQGLSRPKVRCAGCAEGTPPEGLEAQADTPQAESGPRMTPLGKVTLTFDWKAQQARGDE